MPDVQEEIREASKAVDKPIEVTATTLPDQVFTFLRQLVLVFGGFATLVTFLKAGDIAGIIDFLHSSDFVATVIGLVTLGVLIYGNLRTRWSKQELIVTAAHSPDRVAKVVAPKTPG